MRKQKPRVRSKKRRTKPTEFSFKVRVSARLRSRIGYFAKINGRSINAEIIARLEASAITQDDIQLAKRMIALIGNEHSRLRGLPVAEGSVPHFIS